MTRRKSKLSPETAGINYATEQVESEYFMNWVFDQIYEASKMDPEQVHPLETKADAKRAARKMLQQLEWDTKRDLMAVEIERMLGIDRATPEIISEFYEGLHRGLTNPSTVDWLAVEILEANLRTRDKIVEEAHDPHGPSWTSMTPSEIEREAILEIGGNSPEVRRIPWPGESKWHDKNVYDPLWHKGLIDDNENGPRLTRKGESLYYRIRDEHKKDGGTGARENATVNDYIVGEAARNIDPTAWYIDVYRGEIVIHTAGPYSSKREAQQAIRDNKPNSAEWGDPYQGMDMGHALSEPSVVRDYIAYDIDDRRVAGPFRSQGEAQQHVPPGGYVKFSSAQHRRAPPAPSSYPMFRAKEGRWARATPKNATGEVTPTLSEKKTKARDMIRLPDGRQMTLGEALDTGEVFLKEERYYDPPKYFAVSKGHEVSWEIGKTFYESRAGLPVTVARRK